MSLRWRLFLTFALIVVLCLGLVTISAAVILQSQRDRLAMEKLNTMAIPIATQVRSLIRGQVTVADLQSSLKEQSQDNNVFIILTDSKGNVVTQITPDGSPIRLEA